MYDKLNILLQEVISREVLVDEGLRQVVELEQAHLSSCFSRSKQRDHSVRTQFSLLVCVCVCFSRENGGGGGLFLLQLTNLIFIRHEDLKNFLLWLHLVVRKLMEKEFYNSLV